LAAAAIRYDARWTVKVRFGVSLGIDTAVDRLPAVIDRLEADGVDSLWFSELVYSPAVDPFAGMGYALGRSTRLKVGTSVAVLPGRHPVLVAKQLASLAVLGPKRMLPVFGCAPPHAPSGTSSRCPTASVPRCSTRRSRWCGRCSMPTR
jgi:probable F420-dependent oxidoreductase